MLEALHTPHESEMIFRHQGSFDGAELTVTYAVDRVEHEYRLDNGMAAVADEFLLAALLSVPEDRLVRVDSRFEKALSTSSVAPLATVLQDPEGGVWAQRRAHPAANVIGIEIVSSSLRRGCSAAQRWAGYGPRTVQAPAKASTFELTEAAHYGIGVITDEGQQLLSPAPFVPVRWSSARWRFAELVYAQFRELAG
ncbi:hypothetical protein LLS1_01640 [Leifsonia sp. LS1]|uniref:hypothetical protein n=1 Tax=Leifsonia sp. LS1 TaxID=2828483 RepID=UPI001CFD150B|nr:hypothetical protein [Leifsonia sp. LS1]GIT78495.1 hypothetical protein LLS1_01640 [Leifsonia sp. LS1]